MASSDFSPRAVAEIITWERVQMVFAGEGKSITPSAVAFRLSNETTGESVALDDVQWQDNKFLLRINITTVYGDRRCLPNGEWNLVLQSKETGALFPLTVCERLTQETEDDLSVYVGTAGNALRRFTKELTRGELTSYTVEPKLRADGRLYLEITDIHPEAPSLGQRMGRQMKKWVSPFVNSCLRAGFFTVFGVTNAFTRHNGKRIVFCSDSRAELSGNMKDVYDRLIERGLDKDFSIHFVLKESVKSRRGILEKFRAPFRLARADILLLDDFNPTVKQLHLRKEVKVIQLWHACGAFKTVGFSRTGKRGGPWLTNDNHRAYTHAIASSSYVARFYAEAFGMRKQDIYPTGVPRTDVFFRDAYRVATADAMHEALPQTVGKRVILFAPTFRGNGAKSGHYPVVSLHMDALAEFCRKTDSVFLFKMHPFVRNPVIIPERDADVLFDLSAEREINDLLFITDLLITDYSSVIYEASILNIPMLFYAFDKEEYIASRDFYEPYDTFVPGRIVETFEELLSAMESGEYEQEKVKPFCERNFEFRDGKSTDRVIDWLILDRPSVQE